MTPPDSDVLAGRWRPDALLAGSREVEVHDATDTELGTDVVAVLWSDDPGLTGRTVDSSELVLVDHGVDDGIWFAIYARVDGVPFVAAEKAALARAFVPEDGVPAHVPPAESTVEAAAVPRRRGLIVAGAIGFLVLLAAGLLLGQPSDGDGRTDEAESAVEEEIREPLRGALRELRTAAGAAGRVDVAIVEEAVGERDWPAAEQALDRLVLLDPGVAAGRPGRLGIAVDRVRAALPADRPAVDEAPASTPCETTTTTSAVAASSTSSSSTSSTSSTSTTAVAPAAGAPSTTDPCAPTTTTSDRQPSSSTTARSSTSTSTSSTTTATSTSSTSTPSTTRATSRRSTTTSTSPSTTSSSTTTVAP